MSQMQMERTQQQDGQHQNNQTAGLPHIQQGFFYVDGRQIAIAGGEPEKAAIEALKSRRHVSLGVGPLLIELDADVYKLTAKADVSLFGKPVATFDLNRDKPCTTVGGGVLLVSAEVTTCLEFDPLAVKFDGQVCYLIDCNIFSEKFYL